jgi:chemotaxis protein CheC
MNNPGQTGASVTYLSEAQLDALRELANIGSGTAATALSQMIGREVRLSVPRALTLPLADAVDACGQRRPHPP